MSLAGALVGLHATDPATVYLSAWARLAAFFVEDLERCLYDDFTLTRHLCMRRTLFVLPNDLVSITQAAATDAVATTMRARLAKELESEGVTDDGARWLDELSDAVATAVADRGPSTGAELAKAVPLLQTRLRGAGPTDAAVTTRALTLIAAEGRLARGRPQGRWTSSTHRWRAVPPSDTRPLARGDAVAELVRRWLRTFGPAPLSDLAWWTGLGLTDLRAALRTVATVEVDLDGASTLLLADDLDPEPAVDPWVALLPSLDPTPMGWKTRDWYLGAHAPRVFDRTGNIGPTVWCDGRIVGGWAVSGGAKQPSTVVVELFDDIGSDASAAVTQRAAELEQWLGGTGVTPRFPTPIDRQLRA